MNFKLALPSAARLQQLVKLRAQVFGTTYNPDSLRTGSKVLKARLRGPAMLRYYGDRLSGWAGLNKAVPGLNLIDHEENQSYHSLERFLNMVRLIDLEARRKRGKVTPKKGQGRRAAMKKR
ncbi:mitochondral 37S ribosomal protein S27 [Microbotryomycetes sp. JL201]|nr:mitochondral 37S ribosomal protein S27 [Microbotryomycetes sp. JL201]